VYGEKHDVQVPDGYGGTIWVEDLINHKEAIMGARGFEDIVEAMWCNSII